jgi:signal transduction histidine kinase/ActR/RegA family two-component response regulator
LPALMDALSVGAGAALVAEEALFGNQNTELIRWVDEQPPWSDMPFIVLTSRQVRPEVMLWRQRLLGRLRNASLIERPLDALELSSAAEAAVRSRRRQYEVRAYVAERAAAAETLERLVADRTQELAAANSALRQEMAERGKAEEALRQSQKMEAVGQLTGGLAHDFNNLLTGIIGSLDLLKVRVAQGRINELDRYITAAQGASRRAAALTHRLLAFSRRQTLDPKPTNLNHLVAGMQDLVRRTVGPDIALEIVTAGRLWNSLVDPNQLENALLNLCINARDAMPDGGRLSIETANRWLDECAAREQDLAPGQYVSLCVSDTGSGMSPDVIRRAFDPFFTTKPIGLGTGLGLSMVYGFARQSGGHARIYSEPGQGTRVCIYLPRHLGEEVAADDVSAPTETARAGMGETVLVVDDEPTVRMLVTDVLEDLGYTAIEAPNGATALKVLQSKVRVDLLVTDVGLPGGMNGRQVADAGRMIRPGLKVLFITGYAENAVLSHRHLASGMHVMTKPLAMDALANRIKELIVSPPASYGPERLADT